MSKTIEELERENAELRGIVEQVLYMARRYADGTTSTAPHTVNLGPAARGGTSSL